MSITDREIWDKISNGDSKSFKMIHDRYYHLMCLYSNKIINNPEKTKELVSDCFMKLWNKRKIVVVKDSIKNYLLFTLRNAIIDYIRSKEFINKIDNNDIPDVPQEDSISEQEYIVKLHSAIKKLPLQQQRVLNLAIYESMTYKQISEALNIKVNTVKTHIGRAYRFLKEELDPKDFYLFYFLNKKK